MPEKNSFASYVDFVVYGEAGFWAIEVKNTRRVRPEDLGGLKSFAADYPEYKPLLLYRGQERLKIDRIRMKVTSNLR